MEAHLWHGWYDIGARLISESTPDIGWDHIILHVHLPYFLLSRCVLHGEILVLFGLTSPSLDCIQKTKVHSVEFKANPEQRDSVPPPANQQSQQIYNGRGSLPGADSSPVGVG